MGMKWERQNLYSRMRKQGTEEADFGKNKSQPKYVSPIFVRDDQKAIACLDCGHVGLIPRSARGTLRCTQCGRVAGKI